MRPASARLVINSAHAVSLEESTRTSSRVKKSSCGVADHIEFTEDPELPARGVLHGDLSASKISSADYAVTTLPRQISTPVPTLPQMDGVHPPNAEGQSRPGTGVIKTRSQWRSQ
jgi:hypothetical protein